MTEEEMREAAKKIDALCVELGVELWACSCCDAINLEPKEGERIRNRPNLVGLAFNSDRPEGLFG